METNWKENDLVPKKYDDEKEALSIDGFDIKDNTEEKYLIAFEKGTSSRCVFAKISRKIARFHLAMKTTINRVRWFAPAIIKCKPHINHGKNVTVSTMDMQSLERDQNG